MINTPAVNGSIRYIKISSIQIEIRARAFVTNRSCNNRKKGGSGSGEHSARAII